MGSVKGDGLDQGQSGYDVLFGEELIEILGGRVRVLHPHGVLHQPLVYGFCRVRHEDATGEVCLCQNVRQRCGMVHVEAGLTHVSSWR